MVAGIKSRMKTTSWRPTYTHIHNRAHLSRAGCLGGERWRHKERATQRFPHYGKIFRERILRKLTPHSHKEEMPESYRLFLFVVVTARVTGGRSNWRNTQKQTKQQPRIKKTTSTQLTEGKDTVLTSQCVTGAATNLQFSLCSQVQHLLN